MLDLQALRPRFEAKVDRRPVGDLGCHRWTGAKAHGYGTIEVGRSVGARRVLMATHLALALAGRRGPSSAEVVRHRCDTPACVRVDHLELGTQLDNMGDCVARGRTATGTRNGYHTKPDRRPAKANLPRGNDHWSNAHPEKRVTGVRHWAAKLTREQVGEVRRLRATGMVLRELSARFGISIASASEVCRGVSYQEVA